VLFPAAEMKQT